MGYACPVCGDPQSDAGHLANHLAFTAMLRGGDHEDWLDAHVGEWADLDEAALAERVTPHAEEAAFPQVFEDTTGEEATDHEHGGDRRHGGDLPPGADALAGDELDEAAREAIAEARELTRRRRGAAAEEETETEAEAETETETE
jgi:hypothetical protein